MRCSVTICSLKRSHIFNRIVMKFIIGGLALYFQFSLIFKSRGEKYLAEIRGHENVANNIQDQVGQDYANESEESMEEPMDSNVEYDDDDDDENATDYAIGDFKMTKRLI